MQPGELVVLQQRSAVHRVPGFDREAARTPRLTVVFEDDHMAVVVKPQGMPTQVGTGSCAERTRFDASDSEGESLRVCTELDGGMSIDEACSGSAARWD